MRTADCNVFQHTALMPFFSRRLTHFWTTSKLFFAASQLAVFEVLRPLGSRHIQRVSRFINAEQNDELLAASVERRSLSVGFCAFAG
jgi:hypothetical protein